MLYASRLCLFWQALGFWSHLKMWIVFVVRGCYNAD